MQEKKEAWANSAKWLMKQVDLIWDKFGENMKMNNNQVQ